MPIFGRAEIFHKENQDQEEKKGRKASSGDNPYGKVVRWLQNKGDMTSIYQLVQSLSSSQWQALEKYLTCFSVGENGETRLLQLARILKDSPINPNERYCADKLSLKKSIKENSIERLAQRLRIKILDCLAFTPHTSHVCCEKDRDRAAILLNKKNLWFNQLFYSNREQKLVRELLDEIISEAKQYELYSILLEALRKKQWHYSFRHGLNEYDKTGREIVYYKQCEEATDIATDYVNRLRLLREFSGGSSDEKSLLFLNKAIFHLKNIKIGKKLPYFLYCLSKLERAELMLQHNFSAASAKTTEQLDLINKHKSVYKIERLGIVHAEISQLEIYRGNFKEALVHAGKSLEYFTPGTYNYAISKEWKFYSLFFSGDYSAAEECMSETIAELHTDMIGRFRLEKFCYYKACAQFLQGRFKEALQTLSCKYEIRYDKDGWEFYWRVLRMMCMVELGLYDDLSHQTENLIKFLKNNRAKNAFRGRHQLIAKVFYSGILQNPNGYWSKSSNKAFKLIHELNSDKSDYEWKILTAELFPFHNWAARKAGGGEKLKVRTLAFRTDRAQV